MSTEDDDLKLKQDLEWGETPWDDLPREELLRETQRMFHALQRVTSTARMVRDLSRDKGPGSYWDPVVGSGGRSLAAADHVLGPYEKDDRYRERIYRCFFRYAVDLLFPGLAGVTSNWRVCTCGTMLASRSGDAEALGPCVKCGKDGMRPLTWSDLTPRTSATGGAP